MTIVEILKSENGSHRNQTYHGVLPEGWAVAPQEMQLENFPFGDLTAEEIDGVMTVTSWTAGEVPEAEEEEPNADELVDILLGVE